MTTKCPNKDIDQLVGEHYNIETRLRLFIWCMFDGRPEWQKLADATGIGAEKWRQFGRGSTKPSVSMIESISCEWPQYAFWIATGVSDERHGHHAPHPVWSFPHFNFIPEFSFTELRRNNGGNFANTTAFFKLASRLAKQIWQSDSLGDSMMTKSASQNNDSIVADIGVLKALWNSKEYAECQSNEPLST